MRTNCVGTYATSPRRRGMPSGALGVGYRVHVKTPDSGEMGERKFTGSAAISLHIVIYASESAGINRHIVGDERALRKRRSDFIPAPSLACVSARSHSEA